MTSRLRVLSPGHRGLRCWHRPLGAAALFCATIATLGAPLETHAATPSPAPSPAPSAIGAEAPSWIQVAPNVQRTGLVIAVATPTANCTSNCTHLWVSHDGGATWKRAKASGLDGGRPVIAVDSRGHDVLFSASGSATVRSDDGGETWLPVGPSGMPSVAPTFVKDGTVAVGVSGGSDYVLTSGGKSDVPGSGGTAFDMSFAFAPGFPGAGKYAPLLLTAEDKSNRLPLIEQCTANYACHGSATLAGAVVFSSPVTLLYSNAYATDGTVFAQSGRGIYKSSDGGSTFAAIPLGDPSATATATPMMALAPGYQQGGPMRTAWVALFQVFQNKTNPQASHTGGGIYRTDDGGLTWHAQATPGPFDDGAISVAVAPDGRLFGGFIGSAGRSGLLCSMDGGNSWNVACPAEGSAANDPGLSAGVHPAICTACASPTGAAAAASAGAPPTGEPGAVGAGAEAAPAAGSAASDQAAARGKTSSASWIWMAAALAGVLLALTGIRLVRRTGGEAANEPTTGDSGS